MSRRLRLFIRKTIAMVLAIFMSVPTGVFARESDSLTYGESMSVMGVKGSDKKEIAPTKDTYDRSYRLGSYDISLSTSLASDLSSITYKINLRRNESTDSDLSLSMTPDPNSNIKDLSLISAKDGEGSAIETKTNEPDFKDNLESLVVNTKAHDEMTLEFRADIRKAEDKRDYSLAIGLMEDGENLGIISHSLMAKKDLITDGKSTYEELSLIPHTKDNTKGAYREGGLLSNVFTKTDAIVWTDFLANDSGENKDVEYDFDLDENQKTDSSKISLDYYENSPEGFVMKKEFSQEIPFSNHISFEIPRDMIVKISLSTQVEKNETIKSYSLNNREIKNPIYKEGNEKESSDDDPDGGKDQPADTKEDPHKEVKETEPSTDELVIAEDSDGNKVKVEIKDSNEDETEPAQSEKSHTNQNENIEETPEIKEEPSKEKTEALDLNKAALSRKLDSEGALSEKTEALLENLTEALKSYNAGDFDWQGFLESLGTTYEQNSSSIEEMITYLGDLTAGLNPDSYKVALIDLSLVEADLRENYEQSDETTDEKLIEESTEDNRSEDANEDTSPEEKESKESGEIKEDPQEEIAPDPFEGLDKNIEENKEEPETLKENEEGQTSPGQEDKKAGKEALDISKKKDEGLLSRLGNSLKDTFSKDSENLKKANEELKAALKEGRSLEEIQDLLYELGDKYELTREEQGKLMRANDKAIKDLVAYYRENNLAPNILVVKEGLADKKFTIQTRFQTSNAVGPILKGQYFTIHLDDKLKVNDQKTLDPIKYNDETIAEPTYDENNKTITYKITRNINDNIDIPINIDVDYDLANIPEANDDLVITNKVSGLGVTNPKSLLPVKVDRNGNVKGNLAEPGKDDVTKIIEPGENYKVYMDGKANPVYKDGDLAGYNWQITITSDHDLSSNFIGLSTNFTTVEGSGLGEIENPKLNGKPLTMTHSSKPSEDPLTLTNNFMPRGINDSKNHQAKTPSNTYSYTFYTPLAKDANKNNVVQENYMLDFSMLIKGQKKVGAKRFKVPGYDKGEVAERTPNRVGMNNRTTVAGRFTQNQLVKWVITDAVSSGDENTALPLENREITGKQQIDDVYYAYYQIDKTTGKMIRKSDPNKEHLNKTIPGKGYNPGEQPVGTIAVYEVHTRLTDTKDQNSDRKYGLAGVEISPNIDLPINQLWSPIDPADKIPAQELKVVESGNESNVLKDSYQVEGSSKDDNPRTIIIPAVRQWNLKDNYKYEKLIPKVIQKLPETFEKDGKEYAYLERINYKNTWDNNYYIVNGVSEVTKQIPANITILKKDSESGDPIKGASFKLMGDFNTPRGEVITGEDGRATYSNVMPGVYTLQENKAPGGYKLDTESKRITVNDDGTVIASGSNVSMQRPKTDPNQGETVYEKASPAYPSFMNTLHYAKRQGDKVDFYIMLKPDVNKKNPGNNKIGSTNKDTKLKIDIGGANLEDIQVRDVSPGQRETVVQAMYQQVAGQTSLPLISNNNNRYEINVNKTNSGYEVSIPKERFGAKPADNWGFLVKVTGKVGSNTDNQNISPKFTWDNTSDDTKISVDNVVLAQETKDKTPKDITLEIGNNKFDSEDVKVVKVAHKDGEQLKNNDDYLADATFTLRDSSGNILESKPTDKYGMVNFGKLDKGRYTIEETSPPFGYRDTKMIFDVVVDEKGQITYEARGKEGTTPIFNEDYYIEEVESDQQGETEVTVINQKWDLIKPTTPQNGQWYAFVFDSLRYNASVQLEGVTPGYKLKVQFDPRLDFKRSVYNIPDIVSGGKVIAKGFVNTDTNLLTYVFNENVGDSANVTANFSIDGIRPDIYQNKTSGNYTFRVEIDPKDTNNKPNPNGFKADSNHLSQDKTTLDYQIYVNWGNYHSKFGVPRFRHYYKDAYQKDGKTYIVALTYFNPDAENARARKLSFDWMSSYDKAGGGGGGAAGAPAFDLREVKVYQVFPENGTNTGHMPLSNGVRPENNPQTYRPMFIKTGINNQNFNETRNGIRMDFNTKQITTRGSMSPNGPLDIELPKANNGEGYVIEHVFEVTDPDKYYSTWRQFHINLETANEVYSATGNKTIAMADQTQIELPKFYTQRLKVANKPYIPGEFSIIKYDEADNKKLPGAEFTLKNSDQTINQTITRVSDKDGRVDFTNIRPGDYTLKETKAPKDYIPSDKVWKVFVSNSGSVTIAELGLGGGSTNLSGKNIELEVSNRKTGVDFRVYKKDQDGKALEGATFVLKDQNGKQIAIGRSDENGLVEFKESLEAKDIKKLEDGTYILEETKAPAGYKNQTQKWMVKVDSSKAKVYFYKENTDQGEPQKVDSLMNGANWVDIGRRPLTGWTLYDPRATGYTNGHRDPYKMGTRIIGINKEKNYIVQRYVINPEGNNIPATTAEIHREKPSYNNMTWYAGNEAYKVYKLDKPVTGNIGDIRLDEYGAEEITSTVDKSKLNYTGEPARLQLDLPVTNSPFIVDVKVPYRSENAGVGTGMDLRGMDNTVYWKSDYYESVSYIVVGEKQNDQGSAGEESNQGAYLSEGSLDVTNEKKLYDFRIKKIQEHDANTTIEGATFTLTGPGESEETQTIITDKNGLAHFKNLEPGKYRLVETSPAPGYDKADVGWDVYIKEEGEGSKVYIKEDRPKGWSEVDTTNTAGRDTNNANPSYVQTAITDINFDTNKFKQVFIVNNGLKGMGYPRFEIHSQPEDKPINKANTKVNIFTVSKGSKPTDFTKVRYESQPRWEINEITPSGKPERLQYKELEFGQWVLAVEVESDLPEEGEFGLGMDYYPTSGSRTPIWSADSYKNRNLVRLESTAANRSMRDAQRSLYAAYQAATNSDRIAPLDYSHNVTRSTNPIRNRSAMLYSGGLEMGDDLVSYPVRAGNGWEKVDPARSENPTNVWPSGAKSVITEINKNTNRIRQKFLVNPSGGTSAKNPSIEIYQEPDSGNKGIRTQDINFTVTKVKKGSTIENPQRIGGIKARKATQFQPNGKPLRVRQIFNEKVTTPLLIEVEGPYVENGPVGLGINYYWDGWNGKYNDWVTQKYPSENSINKEKDKVTYQNERVKVKDLPIPQTPIRRENKNMYVDEEEKQVYAGEPGKIEEVRKYKYVNGVKTNEYSVVDTIETPAKAPIIEYGTKQRPKPDPEPEPDPEPQPDPEPGPGPDPGGEDPEPEPQPEPEPEPGPDPGGDPDPGTDPEPETPDQPTDEALINQGYVLMANSEGVYETGISNKQSGLKFKVTKVNTLGGPLKDAEFKLDKYKKDTPADQRTAENLDNDFETITAKSDEDGKLVFKDNDKSIKLKPGVYRLTETKEPQNYKPAASHWDIVVGEEKGKLVARRIGPKETGVSFPQSEDAIAGSNLDKNDGIRYKSKITFIDPVERTFVQRIYVDLSNYTGDQPVNVEITPKYKREEIDIPGEPPKTIKKGLKTAYRTTYAVTNPNADPDTIINEYNLYNNNVEMVNTARWRPFDWGFEEDQLNLSKTYKNKPASYIIDVEGYYDENILRDVARDKDHPIEDVEKIPDKDKMKLEMDVTFGKARTFQQYSKFTPGDLKKVKDGKLPGLVDPNGEFWVYYTNQKFNVRFDSVIENLKRNYTVHAWQSFPEASYQMGAANLGITPDDGKLNEADKYPRWLGKKGGRIAYVNQDGSTEEVVTDGNKKQNTYLNAKLSANIEPLYTSEGKGEIIPDADMRIQNEEKTYNITFTKLGRDNESWENNSDILANNRLEGAVFKLQKQNSSGGFTDLAGSTVGSAFNGYIGFRGLSPGTYRLIEVAAPPGYKPTTEPIVTLTIGHKPDGSAEITVAENTRNGIISYDHDKKGEDGKLVDFVTQATATHAGKIINEKPGKGKVTINKVDGENKPLKGAKFKLTRLSSNQYEDPSNLMTWTKEVKSEDGKLVFDELTMGNYRLEEVEPAPGHRLTGGIWNFTIGGKGLDPYAGDVARTGKDLSEKISLESSVLDIIKGKEGPPQGSTDKTIRPHDAESLSYVNTFRLAEGTSIDPGDYFVLKLPDTIDLYGISTQDPTGLDIFADGVVTIAKADYNRQAGTITYTFTDYAKTFTLIDFSNVLSAHINLFEVKKSQNNVDVGLSVNDKKVDNKVNVVYDLNPATAEGYGNSLNMSSKITRFNPETGKFEHFFYVNRNKESSNRPVFRYWPEKNLINPRMTVYRLNNNSDKMIEKTLPESFGIDTTKDRTNLTRVSEINPQWMNKGDFFQHDFGRAINQYDTYLIKITGTVGEEDKSSYKPRARIFWDSPIYPSTYIWAERYDQVFFHDNKATASAELNIKTVNPQNEISFRKVDPEGVVLGSKEKAGSLECATFKLMKKKAQSSEAEKAAETWEDLAGSEKTVGKDGLVKYEKLGQGDYRLMETKAPEGYKKIDGPAYEFSVGEDGNIITKAGGDSDEIIDIGGTTKDIINRKEYELRLKKVDEKDQDKGLKDAEFKVLYKAGKNDEYMDAVLYEKDGTNFALAPEEQIPDQGVKKEAFATGENGELSIRVKTPGYYAIKETKAPVGYIKKDDYVKEFVIKDGKVYEEEGLANITLERSVAWYFKWSMTQGYNNKFTYTINPQGKDITYKDNESTLSIGGLTGYNKNQDYNGSPIRAYFVDNSGKSWNETGPHEYGANNKTFDLYDIVKFLEESSDTSGKITSNKTLVIEIESRTGLDKDINLTTKLSLPGQGEDSSTYTFERTISHNPKDPAEDVTITESSDKEMKTTWLEDSGLNQTDEQKISNKKAEYPFTGGPGVWAGFTVLGLIVMVAGAYVYHRRKLKLG